MKTVLFATVAAMALVASPASAADFSIYLSGLVSQDATYQRITSDVDGSNEKIQDLTPLAGLRYKATLDFNRFVNEATGAVSYRSVGASTSLPFGFSSSGGVNDYYVNDGFSIITVHNNLPGGPANYLDDQSLELNLGGTGLLPTGDVSSFDVAAFQGGNGFFFYQFGTGGASYLDLPADFVRARGNLTIDRVSLSPLDVPAAVPEPASWALIIGGFGLVGGTMRRRNSRATTVRVAYS